MSRMRNVAGRSVSIFLFVTAASLVVSPLATMAHAASKTNATYSYSCCTAAVLDAIYHPGEVIRLPWIATANTPGTGTAEVMVTLEAKISGPYKTVASLKSAFARHTPQLGQFNAEAVHIHISSDSAERYVSVIRVPSNAKPGFYELTTTTSIPSLVTTGGAVIRIDS
jgi:hypothetical protein